MINNEKRKIETYFDMEKTGKALKQDLKVFQTLSITVCTVCIIISTSEIVKKKYKKGKNGLDTLVQLCMYFQCGV